MRTNTCVFEGKWMFETTLKTSGTQRIGWATLGCEFSDSSGVGDSSDSFAYDGEKKKKWCAKGTEDYGEVKSSIF